MPDETSKPVASKVAQPKKPSKKKVEEKAVAKRVNVDAAPKKSILKQPYNHRVRSLARSIVDAIEDQDDKKTARSGLKEVSDYDGIKAFALANIVDNQKQWEEFLSNWFADGVIGEK
jgi:hypothetical protein